MTQNAISLSKLLDLDIEIDVVDIGANPIGDDPPYKALLEAGLARVVGFEPHVDALGKLNARKGPRETYLPDAVYDGQPHELKICHASGMTSLLEPNLELLSYFHGFAKWANVKERRVIKTTRLDDIAEIKNIDYLKIDIQGAELEVFRNGINRLGGCVVIHTEVEFLPMYIGQPLFSEVEIFLRGLGYVFHRFFPSPVSRIVQPMIINDDPYGAQNQLNQLVWTDAVFVKDFTKLDLLTPLQLKKLALILHDIYGSDDISLRALMACDKKEGTNLAGRYTRLTMHAR